MVSNSVLDSLLTRDEAMNMVEHALYDEEISIEDYEILIRTLRTYDSTDKLYIHYL